MGVIKLWKLFFVLIIPFHILPFSVQARPLGVWVPETPGEWPWRAGGGFQSGALDARSSHCYALTRCPATYQSLPTGACLAHQDRASKPEERRKVQRTKRAPFRPRHRSLKAQSGQRVRGLFVVWWWMPATENQKLKWGSQGLIRTDGWQFEQERSSTSWKV